METTLSFYGQKIRETLALSGNIGMDPRHVEAFMRLEHPTLDALSPAQFKAEVKIAAMCVEEGGRDNAESLADSYGL